MTEALLVLLPLGGAVIVLAQRSRSSAAVGLTVLLATAALASFGALTAEGPVRIAAWREDMGWILALDGFGRIMAVLVPLVAAAVVTYAAEAEAEEGGPRLISWILGFVGAMELLVLAGDFLTLLIAWELVGVCSWGLIGYRWRDPTRPRAANQAFLTTRFGDLGLYVAAAATLTATGSLEYSALGALDGVTLGIVAGGVLLAAASKSGQIPFSPWLFSAMAGPTPASALLHSATMVAAGAYALIRLWPWLGPVEWFGPLVVGIGLATAYAGGIVAALQSDVKRALAGSTSSQYGLMFVAVGVGGTSASALHLVTHAGFKALLFLGAGVAIHAAGSGRMDRMRLGRSLPEAGVLMGVGALALAAVPPIGAAFSKEAIVGAAGHASLLLGAAVLASGALTAFYAGRILLLSFGPEHETVPGEALAVGAGPGGEPSRAEGGPRRGELVGMAALATLTLALSLVWLPGGRDAAARALGAGPLADSAPWELAVSTLLLVAVAVALYSLWRRGSLFALGSTDSIREGLAAWLGLPTAGRLLIVRPVLALSRSLARLDDQVIDAGVRGSVAVAGAVSQLLERWAERGFDASVWTLARVTASGAKSSMAFDDLGFDGFVEGVGRVTGAAGARCRRWQTGLSHHYYAVAGAGLLVLLGAILIWS